MSEGENIQRQQTTDNEQQPEKMTSAEETVMPEGEVTTVELQQTTNNQPQSEEMEVHHHAHDPAAPHHKKNWKAYFWEFLMLFLAVFCGFLAEYQLEHKIERDREKEFMASLVKDLESDTAQFNSIKRFRISKIQTLDSSLFYFALNDGKAFTLRQMKFTDFGLKGFYQNSGTLDQLKNAGGFRLIRKRNIVDSISAYDQQIKRINLRDKYETDMYIEYEQVLNKIFDGRLLAKIYADTAFFGKTPPSLETNITLREEYVGEFLNKTINLNTSTKGNLNLQETIKSRAERLIALIKKEYHLE